jgi:putative tricarboxylic transport membrane protein
MKRDDVVAGGLLALVGFAVIVGAVRLHVGTPLHPQPGFFPFLGGGALTLMALVLVAQAALGQSTGTEAFGRLGAPIAVVVGMAVYVAILEPVGYVPGTILIGAVILRVLGVTSWRVLGVARVVLSVGTYLLFARVLGIDLPAGMLEFLG